MLIAEQQLPECRRRRTHPLSFSANYNKKGTFPISADAAKGKGKYWVLIKEDPRASCPGPCC